MITDPHYLGKSVIISPITLYFNCEEDLTGKQSEKPVTNFT